MRNMSDTKWRKLFDAIKASGIGLRQAIIKFIEVDKPKAVDFRSIHLVDARPYADTMNLARSS